MQKVVCHISSVHVRSDVRVFHKESVCLASSGYRVHLIVADGKGDAMQSDVLIHDVGKSQNRLLRILTSPIKVFLCAMKLKADLYHFHDPELLPIGLMLKLCTRAVVIYDAHESYPDDMLHKDYLPKSIRLFASNFISSLESFVARHLDAVVTITDYHALRFLKLNPNTTVVHNFPLLREWNITAQLGIAKKPRTICYVGNITRKRGISMLLKAMEKLDVTLHLAGGYEPAEYRDELISLPAWEKVTEYGYVSRRQAVQIISQAQLGIMLFLPEPNHINSLSTKVFEYMAGGTGVLVSDFPVYSAVVADTGSGVCVNPMDVNEIAYAIETLLNRPDQCQKMGERGKALIYNQYNWEAQEQHLLSLYHKLLNSEKGVGCQF